MVRVGAYRISFIIVKWNTKQLLTDCLKSVLETVRDFIPLSKFYRER
jgi:hypothetical protein